MREALTPIGNPRSSGYERAERGWYVEPVSATKALLSVEVFTGAVWDPACGGGNVIEACLDYGISAIGSDIVKRYHGAFGLDFLEAVYGRANNIITNPPFDQAEKFTLHGLYLVGGKVAILQRTTWLEGERRYQNLFRHGWLKSVWQFRKRISMPPGGKAIPARNGSIAYAWFVFSRSHSGPCSLGWLP